MSTTAQFQKEPDFYLSEEECKKSAYNKNKPTTNPRYSHFKQRHFTAGDVNQFLQYKDSTNGQLCIPKINIGNNVFNDRSFTSLIDWEKYKDIPTSAVMNTFNYMFNKFKKGIFIKIKDNKVRVFLPFSKKNYINEWANRINIDPKYEKYYNNINPQPKGFISKFHKKLYGLLWYQNEQQNFTRGKKKYKFRVWDVKKDLSKWYANNCIVRYDETEGDDNVAIMSDMFKTLCETRKIPDMEFFVNRRDFPIIKRNGTEAYEDMFGTNTPLLSHNYNKYLPILSMVTRKDFSDIPIPTGYGWKRVCSSEGKYFPQSCELTLEEFPTLWKDKKNIAIFRGASTGCGYDINTNIRLKLAYISSQTPLDENGNPYLDAGITKFNTRIRKIDSETDNFKTMNVSELYKNEVKLTPYMTHSEQSTHKYIIDVDGHVSAFRLSVELNMGSVLLLVDSNYEMWFRHMLIPYEHYVPVNEDLSNLIDQIKWCRENDEKCEQIAENAHNFFQTYLRKDGYLDYLQKLLIDIKNETGVYLYNKLSPLDLQLINEYSKLEQYYPKLKFGKRMEEVTLPHNIISQHSYLEGVNWFVNTFINNFFDVAVPREQIFKNKAGSLVNVYSISSFEFIVKSTENSEKVNENIHESYLGQKSLNELRKYIPNFVYIYGHFFTEEEIQGVLVKKSHIITEKINGLSFDRYIYSGGFNMPDYLFILLQLCLALKTAQNLCGFVHWDLAPWNIMIVKLDKPKKYDYILGPNKVVSITTHIVPVIIDYGKSHVIYDSMHHGYVKMYNTNVYQDVYTLLITSLSQIIPFDTKKMRDKPPYIHTAQKYEIAKLLNFYSNTSVIPKKFELLKKGDPLYAIKTFLAEVKNYERLISVNFVNKGPLGLFDYILNNFKYRFPISFGDVYTSQNIGNSMQVFKYIMASNLDERLDSFSSFFRNILECDPPQPKKLFTVYYVQQQMLLSIRSVNLQMSQYLQAYKYPPEIVKKQRELSMKAYKYILNLFSTKLTNLVPETEVTLYKYPKKYFLTEYSEGDFEDPQIILETIKRLTDFSPDLSTFKYIVEQTLLYKGEGEIPVEQKVNYINIFEELLDVEGVVMKAFSSNAITLYKTVANLYGINKAEFNKKLLTEKGVCVDVRKKYMDIYKKIGKIINEV